MNIHADRLLQRFLRYVQIDTTANDETTDYPSSPGQWELGRLLVSELKALGIADAEQDSHALVWGTIPARVATRAPVIALNAHLDTSMETSGSGVRPQVIRPYAGGDLVLPADNRQVIRVADNPELAQMLGRTLVTTDGTTLLGGDDKAGVAVIMECAAYLQEHPEVPHGPVRILFTCDEEIGRGVSRVDLQKLGAVAAYTLDGAGADEIDGETFSADLATLTFRGVNIHPSIAKGRMVNAIRAASDLIVRLPRDTLAPEATEGRQGFLHPYVLSGGVAEAQLKVLLRDFDTDQLSVQAARLRTVADEVCGAFPGLHIDIQVHKQYRNMAEGLAREPRALAFAEEAHRRLGRSPKRSIIRGGTDGSQFTERGLPTPNLSTGQHNPHSPLEWVCLEEMIAATEVLIELARRWGEEEGKGEG